MQLAVLGAPLVVRLQGFVRQGAVRWDVVLMLRGWLVLLLLGDIAAVGAGGGVNTSELPLHTDAVRMSERGRRGQRGL